MSLWTYLYSAPIFGDGERSVMLAKTVIGLAVISYLSAVRALRWRRFNAIHRKYESKYLQGDLSPEEAQEIIHTLCLYEMPMFMNFTIPFALFKAYAIPTISKILCDTKELKSIEGRSKRNADTEILISTWLFCPISGKSQDSSFVESSDTNREEIDDPRAMIALSRVNWLHSKYPITNDDYLYVLGLLIFEPTIWGSYGWRALSPMESQAFYILWAEIGRRMGIRDIPESREAFRQWMEEYEYRAIAPAQENHDVATYSAEELLHAIPKRFGIKGFVERLAICTLEEDARIAMVYVPISLLIKPLHTLFETIFTQRILTTFLLCFPFASLIRLPSQPLYIHAIFKTILYTIGFIQRYLCLPRSQSNPGGVILVPLDKASASASTSTPSTPRTGPAPASTSAPNAKLDGSTRLQPGHLHRMHPNWFQARPWYMPEPTGILGKLKNQASLTFGLYDALPSARLRSEGYRLEEMGPVRYEKHGHEEVMRKAEEMYGCPITGPFSRN
ncbi:hypothetical protein GYMLUDRAFT_263633 [Collybiopsis luxurians FD-317 M1]|uniref:ER-bound oxygenase mpaB/mpaB'/Rubber oxygenase catalytic domain-containing protein n=1 Tax=Collybiopsis luxurians FD-317 M1 TaxID=944289 RepID=A0A0D0C2P6_9AGAR|nr:hypothetical protein GYMLUDRAFT_263633 [Collybiopsis luxurians FD-317 M1]